MATEMAGAFYSALKLSYTLLKNVLYFYIFFKNLS